ncbi:MAG: hypothetical protein ACF8Q5_04265 [Phycisphaerales bacterium JB040]
MAWLFSISGWTIAAMGVAILIWGAWWDRAGRRGRPAFRCRRCWYDLTGIGGEGEATSEIPVVCPECGREHPSKRSMRRTRRKRWGIAVAVFAVLGGYVVSVWPRMRQSNDWLDLVPTPALVLSVAWLPDEPGSFTSSTAPRPLKERLSRAIKVRLYDPDSTTRLDRWLFTRLARGEPHEVLTDPTSTRGNLYLYVYEALARQERMSLEEECWARSVYVLELDVPDVLPQMASVHARVTDFRRLVNDRAVRVRLHRRLYEIGRRTDGGWHSVTPVDLVFGERNDNTVRLQSWVRWPNFISSSPVSPVPVEGTIFEGDRVADIWWPVAQVRGSEDVLIATFTGPQRQDSIVESDAATLTTGDNEVEKWLKKLRVRMKWDHEFRAERPIGISLDIPSSALESDVPRGFTFGGNGVLMAQVSGEAEPSYLGETEPAWWALRDSYGQYTRQGLRVLEGGSSWVSFEPTSDILEPGLIRLGPDQTIEKAWIELFPAGDNASGGNYPALWDLDLERVYPNVIRLDLSPYDVQRLEALWKDEAGN